VKLTVTHVTTYRYATTVTIGHSEARLRPRRTSFQEVLSDEVEILPRPQGRAEFLDYFGNRGDFFLLDAPHRELRIEARSVVAVRRPPLPFPSTTAPWERARALVGSRGAALPERPIEMTYSSPFVRPTREVEEYATVSFAPGRPILEGALDLTRRIHTDFRYESGATSIATPLHRVMAERRGVCQDFAHLGIACLRSLGLPARYVSGYLLTRPPPGAPRLVGADASHAWLSLDVPGHGYVDLDPTNGNCPDDGYVTVAWGRDFGDVSPVKGVILGGGAHSVHAAVDVQPVHEAGAYA
jgi:transglutaminase-like putative cysteine protease